MAQRRWARSFSALLALVLWLCLGLALPVVLSLYSTEGSSDAVEAAPAEAFTLTQHVVLLANPAIVLKRGTVAFVDTSGKPLLPLETGEPTSPRVSQSIKLYNAVLSVGASTNETTAAKLSQPGFPLSPFEATLSSGQYEQLSLRRSNVTFHHVLGEPVTLTDVNANVSLRRRGMATIKGTGLLRGRRVAFDTTTGLAQGDVRGKNLNRIPIKLALKSQDLDLAVDGRLLSGPNELELQGQTEASIPSGRALARWFGAYWPSGPGLRDLSIRGQLKLSRGALAVDNAAARIDGNEGTGVLGLSLRGPRPSLTGTLAFKAFDTEPYLSATGPYAPRGFNWASLAGGALTVPLGMHMDADLRISADRVLIGKLELGRLATTIALKDGKLLADIAEMRFNGGEGGGQLTADFTGFVPKVGVRGKLESVDLGLLGGTLGAGQLLQGKASAVLDLAGHGSTLHEVARALSGKLTIRSHSAGRIGVDLRALGAPADTGGVIPWSEAARSTMPYDTLDLRLILRDGTILTETAEARSGDAAWSAVGVVNLSADRIDLRLSRAGVGAGPATISPQKVIEIHGPLREPRLKSAPTP